MRWLLAACVACVLALPAGAATYLVRPDGTGDFPTIQAAIDAVADGDVIELADGTFLGPGNRDIDYLGKAITVRSQSGNAESCVIDCEGSDDSPHRGFNFHSNEGPGSILQRVTITGGHVGQLGRGGAIRTSSTAPALLNCVFSGNQAGDGGAVYCYHGSPSLSGCLFDGNVADDGGGLCADYVDIRVTGCVFAENQASNVGGGAMCKGGTPRFIGCSFFRNRALDGGGLDCQYSCTAMLTSCTFCEDWTNASGVIFLYGGSCALIENSIIAFGTGGSRALVCSGSQSSAFLTCCDLWGNEGGDWDWWCIEDQYGLRGNISEDPRFCDLETGDLTLDSDSPCAPDHDPYCGLIGAGPVACGTTPASAVSWGRIKAMFRP